MSESGSKARPDDPADAPDIPSDAEGAPAAHRPRRVGLLALVAATALGLDLISKVLIVANVRPGEPHRLIGGVVYLLLTRNSGAAFSIGGGATIVLTAIAIIVVGVIIRASRRLRSIGWAVALGLILGGALGNLADRVFRAPGLGRGHVVDWISVFADDGHVWPIFNLADSSIVCGGILAAIVALRGIEFDGSRGNVTSGSSPQHSG